MNEKLLTVYVQPYLKGALMNEKLQIITKDADEKRCLLFDLLLHGGHSFSLWALELVSCAAKVTQHIMTLVVQEDVLHLWICER